MSQCSQYQQCCVDGIAALFQALRVMVHGIGVPLRRRAAEPQLGFLCVLRIREIVAGEKSETVFRVDVSRVHQLNQRFDVLYPLLKRSGCVSCHLVCCEALFRNALTGNISTAGLSCPCIHL